MGIKLLSSRERNVGPIVAAAPPRRRRGDALGGTVVDVDVGAAVAASFFNEGRFVRFGLDDCCCVVVVGGAFVSTGSTVAFLFFLGMACRAGCDREQEQIGRRTKNLTFPFLEED